MPTTVCTDFLDLGYRVDIGVLTVRWLRAVTLEELQAGFAYAQQQSRLYKTHRWLVDVRRCTELDATSSAWVVQSLLPAVAREVGPATLHVAYLLSPARAQVLQTDPDMQAATTAVQSSRQPYRLQTFLNEGPAMTWLLQQAG